MQSPATKLPSNGPITPALLRVREAAQYLSLGNNTVYVLLKAGALVGVKLGTRTAITRASCDALISRNAMPIPKHATKKAAAPKRGRGRPPKFPQRREDRAAP